MDIDLNGYWCINKTKRYNRIFKIVIFGMENRFLMVSGVNPDPVESIP